MDFSFYLILAVVLGLSVNYFLLFRPRKVFYGFGLLFSISPVVFAFLYNALFGFDGWGGLIYIYLGFSLLGAFAFSALIYEIIHKPQELISYRIFLKFLYFYLVVFFLSFINSFEKIVYRIISYPVNAIVSGSIAVAILILIFLTHKKIKEGSISFYNYFITLTFVIVFWMGYLWFL